MLLFDEVKWHNGYTRTVPLVFGNRRRDEPSRVVQARTVYMGLRPGMFVWVAGDAVDDQIDAGYLVEYEDPGELVPKIDAPPAPVATGRAIGHCGRCGAGLFAFMHPSPEGFLCDDCVTAVADAALAAARTAPLQTSAPNAAKVTVVEPPHRVDPGRTYSLPDKAKDIIAWAGADRERAQFALDVEDARREPRPTVIRALREVVNNGVR